MSTENRRFIRFSLDIPAVRFAEDGAPVSTTVRQISVGGCLAEWDEKIRAGDEFRLELELPNGNRLPVYCKAIYRFAGKGIGAKFVGISAFEQELLGEIISESLERERLPLLIDPFAVPPTFIAPAASEELKKLIEEQREKETAGEILSSEN